MVRFDVRFIAATNQELEPLITEHRFRKDLFFRLNVARIYLPPLAERKEDIPELLHFFLDQYSRINGHHVDSFSSELMRGLLQYEWPGNVRELRNLVEAIFIEPPSGTVSPENLPESFRRIFSRYI
jgi:DNA-binding NtrC family response regulator